MVKIVLESARNGVIKKVIDDNYGGGKEHFTSTDVYESTEDQNSNSGAYIKRFFFDLCDDLGLELGNKFDKNVLDINTCWGSHYEPTGKDIESKIKRLKIELKELEEWKNI
jgi:hypothetical protein